MKKIYALSLLVVFLIMFVFGCGVRPTGMEGKVVDGKGKPLANVKVVAKMSQPIKGYELFETKTGPNGSFKFSKLFPSSEYQLIFYSERWITEQSIKTISGQEDEKKILPEPVIIRFMDSNGGLVLDTKTNLIWASSDNGSTINWFDAKDYCDNYHGGGYTDWRMPTQDELAELHASGNYNYLITISSSWIWAAETRDSEAAYFHFNTGKRFWFSQSYSLGFRVLPVRSNE